ncbi:MAG: hypothetical protein V1899_06930 [Planctomycetota bacterium]
MLEIYCEWAYLVYFALFVLGAILLIGQVLLPTEMTSKSLTRSRLKPIWNWLINYRRVVGQGSAILLLGLCAISQQISIDHKRGFIADQEKRYEAHLKKLARSKNKDEALRAQYLYMPEGDSLIYLSLGNIGLAADYVWLTSLQYVSSAFRRGQKFEMLSRFYQTLLELNPTWSEAAINAGKILSALEPNRYRVEDFYKKAIVNNPDNIRIFYEAGCLFVVPPLDHKQQADYARRAVSYFDRMLFKLQRLPLNHETAILIRKIEDMKARMGLEAAYYDVAAQLLYKHATDPNNPEALRAIAARDWLNAHSLVIMTKVQELVNNYKQQQGVFPPDLKTIFNLLPDKGWNLQKDDFGYLIEYEPESGKVSSRGVNARKAIQVNIVVGNFVSFYESATGKLPESLDVLTQWVRRYHSHPANRPSQVVVDAIGETLDCVNGPLGPLQYDPKTGVIASPPECNVQQLFKNAERLVRPN